MSMPIYTQYEDGKAVYPACSEIRYLGTCEDSPRIIVTPRYKPIPSSIGGGEDSEPMDHLWVGESAIITGTLTEWNELVYEQCISRVNANAGFPGVDNRRGDMMIRGGYSYCLWLRFANAVKTVYANAFVPLGYRFPTAWMIGPDEHAIGNGANKRGIVFGAKASYEREAVTVGSQTTYAHQWLLYDAMMNYIPVDPCTAFVNGTTGQILTCGVGDTGVGVTTGQGWTRPA